MDPDGRIYSGHGTTKLIALIAMLQAHLANNTIDFSQTDLNKLVRQEWKRLIDQGYRYGIPHSVNIPGIKELVANGFLHASAEFTGGFRLPPVLLEETKDQLERLREALQTKLAKEGRLQQICDLSDPAKIKKYLCELLEIGDSKEFAYISPFLLELDRNTRKIRVLKKHTSADAGVDFIAELTSSSSETLFVVGQVKKMGLTAKRLDNEVWKIPKCDQYWLICENISPRLTNEEIAKRQEITNCRIRIIGREKLLKLINSATDNEIRGIGAKICEIVQWEIAQIEYRASGIENDG
ncbi:MAG: hypothetical protein ACXACI_18480 [Candidatus Hodarchaeales archaeon]|jgi:hypothetical protein